MSYMKQANWEEDTAEPVDEPESPERCPVCGTLSGEHGPQCPRFAEVPSSY
jgi:hypothetical protein